MIGQINIRVSDTAKILPEPSAYTVPVALFIGTLRMDKCRLVIGKDRPRLNI